jgi:hypothetical protein
MASVTPLFGCNGGTTTPSQQTTVSSTADNSSIRNSKLKDQLLLPRMGSGFDTSSNSVTTGQSCLAAVADQTNILISNPSAMLDFEQQYDLDKLQKNLDVNVTGSYTGGRFSASIAAQFVQDSKDDAYSTNLIYLYKYVGQATFKEGSLKQGDDALTPVARSFVHTSQKFREMCGNSFIEQMDAGAVLAVKLTLSFNSHQDQEKFLADIKGSYNLANVAVTLKQAAASEHVHIGFKVSAIQLGGKPEGLNDIFKKDAESEHYPIVACGDTESKGVEACKKLTDDIITYSKSMKDQLQNSDGSLNLNNLYYTSPVATSYSRLGIVVGAPDPSPEVLQAMRDLTRGYDKTLYDYTFVKHYKDALYSKLDSPVKFDLDDAYKKLQAQLRDVYLSPTYRLLDCYRGYVSENCILIKNRVNDALKDYALPEDVASTIDYLENNSYAADLYTYNGFNPTEESSYVKTRACILAPISYDLDYKYALNCDGMWLDTPKPITILPTREGKLLTVNGLSYFYIPQEFKGKKIPQKFTYSDSNYSQVPSHPNYYYHDQIDIVKGATGKITEGVAITKLRENQA